jgi:CubicO group peptidase (beta-lactamase class C family)
MNYRFPRTMPAVAGTIKTLVVIFLFLLTAHLQAGFAFAESPAETGYAAKLDAFIHTQMVRYQIPGMAAAVVRGGSVEYLKGFGIANQQGDPITPETPFLLASVSKSFTAVGIMRLIEAGKISLDDPVRKHLPWFTAAGSGADEITVAHLLNHSSGFSELAGREMNLRPDSADALEAGVRHLAKQKLKFKPGSGWEYSNINYNVLGLLIEQVSEQSYERFIRQTIFTALGMNRSFISLPEAKAANAASGYYPFLGIPLVYDAYMPYSAASAPAAGVWSSAADMSRYLIEQLKDSPPDSPTLLSIASMQQLHKPGYEIEPGFHYAMGWFHAPRFLESSFLQTLKTDLKGRGDLQVLWHEGDWLNYKAMALLLPELDYGVILLMNTNDPTIGSVFKNFAWDVTLIATNGDAYDFRPSEGVIVRHARWIFGGIPLLLIGGIGGSLLACKKAPRPASPNRFRGFEFWLVLFVTLGVLGYIHLKLLPDNAANIPVLLNLAPDLGMLVLLISLLSVGWIGVSAASARRR